VKTKMARVTITLPEVLLEDAERNLAEEDETRSALIRRLIEQALKAEQESKDVEQWIRAYQEQPQTDEEVGWMEKPSREYLAEIPW
jgi:metal-responsive CopG/Arc/MetJ family transcriptional regulator